MHYTIEKIINGDIDVIEFYKKAVKRWNEILKLNLSIDDLAIKIGNAQYEFEGDCGDRDLGKEIMAVSAFAHLYTTQDGFGDNQKMAEDLLKAFYKSHCSGEVISIAGDTAKYYYLDADS